MSKFEFTKDYGEYNQGDVIEYDPLTYHKFQHPLLMQGILRDTEKEARKKEIKEKEEVNLDLNRDGRFDKEDAKIAGKALAKARYDKKNKKSKDGGR